MSLRFLRTEEVFSHNDAKAQRLCLSLRRSAVAGVILLFGVTASCSSHKPSTVIAAQPVTRPAGVLRVCRKDIQRDWRPAIQMRTQHFVS